ncbi:GNAT family N-acetyltransferase [Lysinibacillus sp. LZ02]|uniref:GNAT family N-acetyltransferase n=1 Tax=Lysinibacillus sp. LZ02 TaxID=3420668 RepID=UPI003D35E1E3
MPIIIRTMQSTDVEAVEQVAINSWHATYEGIIPKQIQDNFLAMAYNKKMLQKRLEQTPFYVAEENGKIIGFANFSNVKDQGEVELAAIYLLPEAQCKGVGSKLLTFGIKQLLPKAVYINVESDNQVGKQFYLARNFKIIDEFEEDFDGYLLQTTRMVLEVLR